MTTTKFIGFAFIGMGLLVVLALGLNYLLSGYWVALSTVDTVAFVSVGASGSMTMWLSDSDPLYFVFADAPLYAVLMLLGSALVALTGVLRSRALSKSRRLS